MTTLTLEKAMAAPAMIGLPSPILSASTMTVRGRIPRLCCHGLVFGLFVANTTERRCHPRHDKPAETYLTFTAPKVDLTHW